VLRLAYRDKKVVGVFVRFRELIHIDSINVIKSPDFWHYLLIVFHKSI
jgi:hypothetical protein